MFELQVSQTKLIKIQQHQLIKHLFLLQIRHQSPIDQPSLQLPADTTLAGRPRDQTTTYYDNQHHPGAKCHCDLRPADSLRIFRTHHPGQRKFGDLQRTRENSDVQRGCSRREKLFRPELHVLFGTERYQFGLHGFDLLYSSDRDQPVLCGHPLAQIPLLHQQV